MANKLRLLSKQANNRAQDSHDGSRHAVSTESTDVPVLLLGNGVTAVAATRCLARAGITVYCASDDDEYLRHCRWYLPVPGAIGPLVHTARLNDYLRTISLERAVVIPCADNWVIAAAEIAGDLRDRFATSLPSPEIVRRLIDKMTLGGLLKDLDIPHPRSMPVAGENHLRSIFNEISGTFFLKPRESQRFFQKFGVKAFLVDNVDDALDKYRRINAEGLGVILQEYIPGPPDDHYYVEGFVDRNGEFQAWFARRRIRIYPPVFGNSTYMESVPLPMYHDAFAFAAIRHLMRATDYRGIFSAEFKKDERDFYYKLLEVNVRPWWYVEAPYRCGIDVVTMAYHDALGHDIKWSSHYTVGKRFYSPYYDWAACKEARKTGELGLGEWARHWFKGSSIFFAWDDPMPTIYASRKLVTNRLRRMIGLNQRPKAEASKSG